MDRLPFLLFDADNHCYEALDAFTRHLDARLALMDQQRIEKCFLFPTLGVGMAQALSDAEIRLVMRESALGLAQRRPASAA